MILTAKQAVLQRVGANIKSDSELSAVLTSINSVCTTQSHYTHKGDLQPTTISSLEELGYEIRLGFVDHKAVYDICWDSIPVDDSYLDTVRFSNIDGMFEKTTSQHKALAGKQTATIVLCIIIIILLLLSLFFVVVRKEQVGLVALVDAPAITDEIPDNDPLAIMPPADDTVKRLNEKLDMGKMCINMVGAISFKDAYASGHMNIYNDQSNNFPQFVTIVLDSNGTQVYQSGLIGVGKCIPYDSLDIVLPKGRYDCTAIFSQVDTSTNKICGKAAAKVVITIEN